MKHKHEKKLINNSKLLKSTIIIFIILIILLGFIILLLNLYVDSKLGKLKQERITNDTEELGIREANSDESSEMSNYRNIAILGLDSRYDTYDNDYRTDCIMIVSINKNTNDIQLYSIYRDTYVYMEMDNQIKFDKINHAYYNGIENTIKTINKNLDLNVTEYIISDFSALVDLIDQIGGIEIKIDSEEIKYINDYIKDVSKVVGKRSSLIENTGLQKLNGIQAVAYCRIRYTSGMDYKRTERMRTVINKVIAKIKSLDITQMLELLDIILPNIRTNISTEEIKKMIPQALNFNFTKSFGWPYETEGIYLKGDFFGPAKTLESNVKKLHQEVYNQKNYNVPEEIKQISEQIIKETGVK